jgi:hypothetical protein
LSRVLARGALRELVAKGASDAEIFSAVAVSDAAIVTNPRPEVKA